MKKLWIAFCLFIIPGILVSACGNEQARIEQTENITVEQSEIAQEVLSKIDWIDIGSKRVLGYSDDLLNGKLCIGNSVKEKPDYNISDLSALDWNMQVGSIPNTYQLYLQALNPVCFLAGAYDMTGQQEYMDLAWDIFESWNAYRSNDELSKDNVYVWDSHGMAMRTENLVVFSLIGIKNGYFDNQQLDELNTVLELHGDYLTDNEYYHEYHNHGVTQDRALLVLYYYFHDDRNLEWVTLAKKRLEEQWNYEFTDEMMSTENSFGYLVFNKNLYTNIMEYLEANGDSWGKEKLERLKATEDIMGWMVKPNGNSASFGESSVTTYDSATGYNGGVLQYSTSRGELGNKPENNSVIYPDAGYYIGREYWDSDGNANESEPFDQSAWVLFKSGFLSKVHKQDDDTSFEFYAKGHDIFVDPGFFGYVSNDLRAYLTSSSAHNMITVDGGTYFAKKQEPGNAGIEYYDVNDKNPYDYVIGYNHLNNGVELKRHFVFFGESILLYDESKADKEHIYTQNFQCGPALKVVKYSDTEVLLQISDTEYFVRIKQLNENTTCEILHGDEDTNYGQYSPQAGNVEYIDTIRFRNTSKNLDMATLITIEDAKGHCIDFDRFSWDNLSKAFIFENDGSQNKLILKR